MSRQEFTLAHLSVRAAERRFSKNRRKGAKSFGWYFKRFLSEKSISDIAREAGETPPATNGKYRKYFQELFCQTIRERQRAVTAKHEATQDAKKQRAFRAFWISEMSSIVRRARHRGFKLRAIRTAGNGKLFETNGHVFAVHRASQTFSPGGRRGRRRCVYYRFAVTAACVREIGVHILYGNAAGFPARLLFIPRRELKKRLRGEERATLYVPAGEKEHYRRTENDLRQFENRWDLLHR